MNNPTVFIICGIFILLAFIMNEKSAKFLLAGYNTMPEEDRKKYNIKGFLKVFRLTFLIAGIGTLLMWYLLVLTGYQNYANMIILFLPVIAVMFIVIQGQRYYSVKNFSGNTTHRKITYGVLGAVAVFITLLFYSGLKENSLNVSDGYINISGMYGEKIPCVSVTNVEMTNTLPVLSARTNGFAFNKHLKGYFKTKDGTRVKLFVSAGMKEYLKISTVNQNYFWNSGSQDMEKVSDEIKNNLK